MSASTYYQHIANILVAHSCSVQPGERVLIESIDVDDELTSVVAEAVHKAGGTPFVVKKSQRLMVELGNLHSEGDLDILAEKELILMKKCQCFIGLRAPQNLFESRGLTQESREKVLKYFVTPVHYQYRNKHLRWVYLRIPTKAMAQQAEMPSARFFEYYFTAISVDYASLHSKMLPLQKLLDQTNSVRITHPNGTDLKFRLSGKGTYISAGYKNVPDGEIFTSPYLDSVEGRIVFNIPSTYYGHYFEEVDLEFKSGKVVSASAGSRSSELNSILDIDQGARYIGEFALGVNPNITKPINDILFDEKMQGSIHLALGNAYPISDNGNRSSIHWDLILAQMPEYGGGAVYFDDQLIRQDGVFIPSELSDLNQTLIPGTFFQ